MSPLLPHRNTIVEGAIPTWSITGVGQIIGFKLLGFNGLLQFPFDVTTTRFDAAASTMAVHTNGTRLTDNHPLDGWRYWSVIQLAPGQLRIETGAFDRPNLRWFDPFFLKNWLAFHYFGRKDQTETWRQGLEFIASNMPPGTVVVNRDLVTGTWGFDYTYIMTQVCGAPPQADGFCQ